MEAYRQIVRPGGVIAGDDYAITGWWASGVVRAVDEFAETVGKKPLIYGNQFLFRL